MRIEPEASPLVEVSIDGVVVFTTGATNFPVNAMGPGIRNDSIGGANADFDTDYYFLGTRSLHAN